jgi:uncharacterized membrane protein YcaP (DUF421 family)
MESILRGAITYFFVWLVFRISGKRTLAQITTFDALLLLIISETVQQALTATDNSMTNSFLLILTMVGIDVVLSHAKQWSPTVGDVVDGVPTILIDHEGLHQVPMQKERIDEDDILEAARSSQGLGNLNEIEYAVLEQHGGISIVPKCTRDVVC